MTDTHVTEVTPATRDAAERAASKAKADADMAALVAAHRDAPEQRIQRDRNELERLQSDPHTLARSQREIDVLKGRISQAEAGADAAVASRVLSDAQRVDLALKGETFRGPQSSTENQIFASDFADAIQSDLAAGVRPELVKSFYATGRSNDRLGHVAAQMWLDRFSTDAELQQKFANGDGVTRM